MNKNIKKFVGEAAYNVIQNIAVDGDKLRAALVTPQNARNVFADLTEFEAKSLCTEICNSGEIGVIRQTSQEEIKAAFGKAGYSEVIFDDENRIREAQKYYRAGETICTYNNLPGRMREYFMIVAIKENIDDIKHATEPQREDNYGTSILNIQIARNGSHMSIKNRYNHAVNNPDATFNNNLDMVSPGLQSMVLGYYGFASLNREKSSYQSIVKIGGIYLKWHTEHNNKYYGAFVMGAAGAEYTDTSRYYVTDRINHRRWNINPLVLDFHKKEVAEKGSKKAALVGRALKEGILSSANKEQANYIIATFADAKRELLETNRKALKFAAEVYGYDFQKPFTVSAVMGKWTAKSIEKAFAITSALLFVCDGNIPKVVDLNGGKFCANDMKSGYDYNLDRFVSQGDFEQVRKSGESAVFVVNQDRKYRREVKEKDRGSRYYQKPDELDKCGNNLTESRRQLQNRLNAYKKEKRLKEAASRDYTEGLKEIESRFAELKAEIITALTNAETRSDYDTVNSAQGYTLSWLVEDIRRIRQHAELNDFESVQSATSMISRALETIANLRAKLTLSGAN